jgi:biopolymer transport protein ExbD
LVPLWFHPGLHFARQAIRLNHEFIADQAALQTISVREYQQQLLEYLQSKPTQAIVSSLNFSLTKKRLAMMNKNAGGPFRWVKAFTIVPLITGVVYMFSDREITLPDETSNQESLSLESTSIRLKADGSVEIEGRLVENEQLGNAFEAINKENSVIFSAEPGVKMGVLADVQEMLRKNDIIRVVYQQSNEVFGSAVSEEHDIYYRNATFLVEDAAGEFVRKDYEQLSADEKSYLISSPKAPALISPTAEMWEAWRDSPKYSFWLDGERITVEKLAGISPAEIVFYFSSFMSPEVYHVRLFTADGYENTFGSESGFASPLVEDDIFYIHPWTKRVNYGRTIVKNRQSPVDMYLRLYHDYSSRFDGKGDDDLSEWEQAIGWQYFTELGGRYYRLSAANKKLVPRAKRPAFQYWVPLKKDGIRYYKKQNELTDEEKKQLSPPPPPPSEVKDEVSKEGSFHATPEHAVTSTQTDKANYSFAGLPAMRSNDLQEYLVLYGQYQLLANENRFLAKPSIQEIEELFALYRSLDAKYKSLHIADRMTVKGASFSFVKMEVDGKVVYKKTEELTAEERKSLAC